MRERRRYLIPLLLLGLIASAGCAREEPQEADSAAYEVAMSEPPPPPATALPPLPPPPMDEPTEYAAADPGDAGEGEAAGEQAAAGEEEASEVYAYAAADDEPPDEEMAEEPAPADDEEGEEDLGEEYEAADGEATDDETAAAFAGDEGAGAAAREIPVALRSVEVFYGTNRARSTACAATARTSWDAPGECRPNDFYTGDAARVSDRRAHELEVGTVTVTIPPAHETGKVERPPRIFTIQLRAEDPRKDVVIWALTAFGSDFAAWAGEVRAAGKDQAFVYVHGYATPFDDAARRAAQVAIDLDLDLDFGGLPMIYSWPSQGKASAYVADYDTSHDATEAFLRFLDLVKQEAGIRLVHVIAHSMGNHLVANALRERHLALGSAGGGGERLLDHLVLAAPDVPADRFKERFLEVLPRLARRVTLYVSDKDVALQASEGLRDGKSRAGQRVGGLLDLRVPGFEGVDATPLDTDFLSHSYYANNDSMLSDMFCLFKGAPPTDRPLIRVRTAGLNWEFLASEELTGADAQRCQPVVAAAGMGAGGGREAGATGGVAPPAPGRRPIRLALAGLAGLLLAGLLAFLVVVRRARASTPPG